MQPSRPALALAVAAGVAGSKRAAGALVAVVALFAAACQPATSGASLESFKKGEFADLDFSQDLAAPASPFIDASGAEHTFANYKGKTVVFNIWAEWCAPCVDEMPTLAKLQKAFPDGDVVVVPVAFGDEDARDSARDTLKSLVGDDLPFFYDSTFNVTYDAKTGSFPSTIIYDAEGQEVARLLFPADWSSPQAVNLVTRIRDGAKS